MITQQSAQKAPYLKLIVLGGLALFGAFLFLDKVVPASVIPFYDADYSKCAAIIDQKASQELLSGVESPISEQGFRIEIAQSQIDALGSLGDGLKDPFSDTYCEVAIYSSAVVEMAQDDGIENQREEIEIFHTIYYPKNMPSINLAQVVQAANTAFFSQVSQEYSQTNQVSDEFIYSVGDAQKALGSSWGDDSLEVVQISVYREATSN